MAAPVSPPVHPDRFLHEAFLYRHEAEFLSGVLPFVREGVERDETVVVVEPRPRVELLRDALGADAAGVRFLDMAEVGRNPARIVPLWSAAVAGLAATGRPLRGVGEPAFAGRRGPELVECRLHEHLLNSAFTPGPPWRLLCPYDERLLPPAVLGGALHTHPLWSTPARRGHSDRYAAPAHTPRGEVDPADPAGYGRRPPLPPPTDVVLRGEFGTGDVAAVQRTVEQYARSCGLPDRQAEALRVAAGELAATGAGHGGGSLALWREPDALVVEVVHPGRLTDPMAGRHLPAAGAPAAGLYLVNQLCDLVQVRSGAGGTTVRISTWL